MKPALLTRRANKREWLPSAKEFLSQCLAATLPLNFPRQGAILMNLFPR
jgi:hypothetical protein